VSEYQYYEFRAIDRPLDERAMTALSEITSRGKITSTSLVCVYNYGNFRGNPDKLIDSHFDAHLYISNWGTRRLMFRLPTAAFSLMCTRPYCNAESLEARVTKDHVVLDFRTDLEGGGGYEEGEGWLDTLLPLRADLLAGDLRCVYLGWLAGLDGDADEDATEPPVPPGLGKLTASLKRFADFLRVDDDLIAAAAASSESMPDAPANEEVAAWVGGLPAKEKDKFIVRLMQSDGAPLGAELHRQFRADLAQRKGSKDRQGATPPACRTVGALFAARDRQSEENRRLAADRTAKEQAKREREQVAARARRLDSLTGREAELWKQVEAAIGLKQAKQYDSAVELLKDLRDLAERTGSGNSVAQRVAELRQRHGTKRTLIERLDRAGFKTPGTNTDT